MCLFYQKSNLLKQIKIDKNQIITNYIKNHAAPKYDSLKIALNEKELT